MHGLVHQMEEAHVGMQTPSASSAEVASRTQQLEAKLAKAEGEREALRAQLMELQPVELPPSLHKQLGTCMTAGVVESRAAALEHDLEEADAETEQLARELRELQAALLGLQVEDATSVLAGRMAAVGTGPVAGAAAAASPEAAAATPSQDAAAATGLLERAHQQAADLQVRLEQLERRNRELAELLEEVQVSRVPDMGAWWFRSSGAVHMAVVCILDPGPLPHMVRNSCVWGPTFVPFVLAAWAPPDPDGGSRAPRRGHQRAAGAS